MDIARPAPSLSVKGWIYQTPEVADKIMCYYFLGERSQSDWYDIVSLPYHIATKGNNPIAIKSLMTDDLGAIFSRYFPEGSTIDIEVYDKTADGNDIARYEIQASVIIVVGGVKYSVAKLVSVVNSQISILANAGNG